MDHQLRKGAARNAAYQVVRRQDKRQLTEFLIRKSRFLLPMVKLIEQAELAVDERIDVMGRAAIRREHPSAASSLREGLGELFTINRLGLPGPLRRCLGTTNLIDSSHAGVRQRTRRVTNWQDGSMALRWAGAAFKATETSFRRIMGHEQLWMLKAALDEPENATTGHTRKVG